MQRKKIYLSIGIIFSALGLILSVYYRPYIYNNNINDFGLADTIGSLVSVIAFCTIIWGLKDYSDKEKNIQIILATFIYAVFWEFFGYLNIYGTFDKKDIIAGLISGIITFLIKTIIENYFNGRKKS